MAANPSLRVVVVDDDVDWTDVLAMQLQTAGHEVIQSYGAKDAIEEACACQPDVMFIDLAMPRLDGYQVARRVRQHDSCKDTLLVAVTAFADDTHRQLAKEAGFDHYLVKPVDFPVLRQVVDSRKKHKAKPSHPA
jgi:CheY-like chemotaxis protein